MRCSSSVLTYLYECADRTLSSLSPMSCYVRFDMQCPVVHEAIVDKGARRRRRNSFWCTYHQGTRMELKTIQTQRQTPPLMLGPAVQVRCSCTAMHVLAKISIWYIYCCCIYTGVGALRNKLTACSSPVEALLQQCRAWQTLPNTRTTTWMLSVLKMVSSCQM